MIRPVQIEDAEAIARIYNHYILNTVITFEEQTIAPQMMLERMQEVSSYSLPWLAAESEEGIAGYAYATRWKDRSGYRYSAEISVYLDPGALGLGYGSQLYESVLGILRRQEIHTVIGGIALPNPASVRLHEKFGFQKTAHFKEVGYKFGQWIDVGYWQLLL